MKRLQSQVALVTGASKGIGFAIARSFAEEGCGVMLCARTEQALRDAAETLQSLGASIAFRAADVSVPGDVDGLVKSTLKQFGHIDILVNNAGIGIFKEVDRLSDEEWKHTLATNLTGPFYLMRACLPLMKKQRSGHIITISSLAGQNPFAGGSAYCASKFGLNGLTECVMLEARSHNIKVTLVCPGSVDTTFAGGRREKPSWKVAPEDIGRLCVEIVLLSGPTLVSKYEVRPVSPPKK